MDKNDKRKVAAALAATIAASGAAVDASFDDPADLLQQTAVEPQVEYVNLDGAQDTDGVQDEDKQTQAAVKQGPLREWILHLPLAVRAIFILPVWAVGHLVMTGVSFLFAGLSPILQWALGFVLMALVIAAAFTVTAKAMFPDLPLKKILNKHSIKWILIVSVVAWGLNLILGVCWSGYAQVRSLVVGGLLLLSIASIVIWFARREHRRRLREEETAEIEAVEEEPKELVYTSMGQTFTIRPPAEESLPSESGK